MTSSAVKAKLEALVKAAEDAKPPAAPSDPKSGEK